ncbi:MAG: ribosome-associated translation inhibitor RaiA [Salibacteraceae bacterium]|jgi:ribosome-associated translation inhibitor RaiA
MTIQINTDNNILGNEKLLAYVNATIANKLARGSGHITRIEVHLSDENGSKTGQNDKRCMLEARLRNRAPIAVVIRENTIEKAVNGALDKLKTSMETIYSQLKNH